MLVPTWISRHTFFQGSFRTLLPFTMVGRFQVASHTVALRYQRIYLRNVHSEKQNIIVSAGLISLVSHAKPMYLTYVSMANAHIFFLFFF